MGLRHVLIKHFFLRDPPQHTGRDPDGGDARRVRTPALAPQLAEGRHSGHVGAMAESASTCFFNVWQSIWTTIGPGALAKATKSAQNLAV